MAGGTAVVLAPSGGTYAAGQVVNSMSDFSGPVRVATGDVNGDGIPDYVAGAGPGGGPRVVIVDGATGARLADFYAFESTFTGGVYVTCGTRRGTGGRTWSSGPGTGNRAGCRSTWPRPWPPAGPPTRPSTRSPGATCRTGCTSGSRQRTGPVRRRTNPAAGATWFVPLPASRLSGSF